MIVVKERVIYPDGTRETIELDGYHNVGDYFFQIGATQIFCWQVVEILKGHKVKVERHPDESELKKKTFGVYAAGLPKRGA